jgi:ribonuclease HII
VTIEPVDSAVALALVAAIVSVVAVASAEAASAGALAVAAASVVAGSADRDQHMRAVHARFATVASRRPDMLAGTGQL